MAVPVARRVRPDTVVSLAYRLCDERGQLLSVVSRRRPLRYVHGYAQVLPGLEAAVEGWAVGQRGSMWLEPDEAFGQRDDDAIVELDRADVRRRVRVGDELLARGTDGEEIAMRIIEVAGDLVRADLNHPLAGRRVRFEVEVCGLRDATDAELDEARAEVEERIRDDGAIVYGAASGSPGPPAGEQLVKLRRRRDTTD